MDPHAHVPRATLAVVSELDDLEVAAEFDAGDMACGELVLELRKRMKPLRAGELLRLIALDPGAPSDMPAWCRLTGHRLRGAEHPVYLIEHRPDKPEN